MRRLLALTMLVAVVFPSSSVHAQVPQCFAVPGITNCIEGRFLEFWQQNGGLAVFGYPITAATQQTTGEGTFLTQYFERNRFEYHPDKARPYDVLLGRLGDDRLKQQGRDWYSFPKGQPNGACLWFAETNHSLCEPFKSYWEGHGLQDPALNAYAKSLALFGLPLSEPAMETNSSGDTVMTQWFERARFENHGAQGVLLGLLGNETRSSSSGATPTPTPPPAVDLCANTPPSIDARVLPSNCVKAGATVEIDVRGFQPNEQTGFWLTGPDGSIVGTVRTVNIGPTGSNALGWDTSDPFWEIKPGVWYWVFQGVSSNHKSIAYIRITSTSPPPPGPTPTPPPGPTPTPTPTSPPASNCDPSYPDVCIPPPPPDLNCDDIPYRNFRVLPPDPHHFDKDHDGIGCET